MNLPVIALMTAVTSFGEKPGRPLIVSPLEIVVIASLMEPFAYQSNRTPRAARFRRPCLSSVWFRDRLIVPPAIAGMRRIFSRQELGEGFDALSSWRHEHGDSFSTGYSGEDHPESIAGVDGRTRVDP